jgi:uncharacterized membrane protein
MAVRLSALRSGRIDICIKTNFYIKCMCKFILQFFRNKIQVRCVFRAYIYFLQISVAAFCLACILSLSATEGSRVPVSSPQCKFVCHRYLCGVINDSDCRAGEEYMDSRRWCGCCYANCCSACVRTLGT